MSDDRWAPGHDGYPRPEPTNLDATTPSERDRYVTPDGVPLSGWWRRWLAYVVDGIIVSTLSLAVGAVLHLLAPAVQWSGTRDVPLDDLFSWTLPDPAALLDELPSILLALLGTAVYSILMTSRLGWTLGKRLLGIRVRHRDHERLPTVAEATIRWAVQLAPTALTLPPISALAAVWTTVDGLRPLWDGRRQAFHDLAAGTSVVRA